MKTFFIVISGIAALCIAITWLGVTELYDINRTQQSDINFLRKRNVEEKDSLETVIKITQDSLEIAFNTIRQASIEREKAHAETQRLIKRYEKIIYVRFANDSARVRAITELYPSFSNN